MVDQIRIVHGKYDSGRLVIPGVKPGWHGDEGIQLSALVLSNGHAARRPQNISYHLRGYVDRHDNNTTQILNKTMFIWDLDAFIQGRWRGRVIAPTDEIAFQALTSWLKEQTEEMCCGKFEELKVV